MTECKKISNAVRTQPIRQPVGKSAAAKSNGRARLLPSPVPLAPWRETTCRTCGAPKTAHDADCPEDNDILSLTVSESQASGIPFTHVHDPATCHHCQANRELANKIAFGVGATPEGGREVPDCAPEKIPLEYWDSLVADFRKEIAGQQQLLADVIAIRAKFYPDAPKVKL
jgi:hypothetical protein